MRITLQAPKAENSLSVHTVISKSGVFIEILFLLVTVFEEEKWQKNPQQKPNKKPPQTPNKTYS